MTDKQAARQLKNDIRNYLKHLGQTSKDEIKHLAMLTADHKLNHATTEKQKERWAAVKALLA